MLIAAFSRLAGKYPAAHLTIWGEGPSRKKLETLRQQLQLVGRISLPGATDNTYGVLQSADIFVLSSRVEGFPNALCEAMAIGIPVIGFDCATGPREIIKDGIDGILVPEINEAALASALDRLLPDKVMQEQFRKRSIEILDRFKFTDVLAKWEELFKRVQPGA